MPDTNEPEKTVLVKYIANADLRDGTETIRLADAADGTSRELKRGGAAVEVTRAELVLLGQGFEIEVADESGNFASEQEPVEQSTADQPSAPSAPASPPAPTTPSTPAASGSPSSSTPETPSAPTSPTTPETPGS